MSIFSLFTHFTHSLGLKYWAYRFFALSLQTGNSGHIYNQSKNVAPMIEAGKCYIQKNPLLGRKVLRVDRLRESVWDWNLCDLTAVWLTDAPCIECKKNLASSVYDNQGLIEIPELVFTKILSLARLYEAVAKAEGMDVVQPQANEAMARCFELLAQHGIIDDTTYDAEHLQLFALDYERYTRAQMHQVTDVIDVHK